MNNNITGYTLIDITSTRVISDDTRSRNQQRNWETLKQVLGLRTQVDIAPSPAILQLDLSELKFGNKFKGKQLVWRFEFSAEQISALGVDFNVLKSDFELVPVILNLAETVTISSPLFKTSGNECNIYFE